MKTRTTPTILAGALLAVGISIGSGHAQETADRVTARHLLGAWSSVSES